MEAKELMINDIVGSRFQAQPMRYSGIFTNYEPLNEKPYTRLRLMFSENEGLDVPECDVVPIPLTPEILEKNGFWYGILPDEDDMLSLGLGVPVDIEKRWVFDNENGGTISITFPNESDGGIINIHNDDKHLSFVWYYDLNIHELQHALRLCGLSDIADNFKV